MTERVPARRRVRQADPKDLVRTEAYRSSGPSAFEEPIVFDDPEIRDALRRSGILRSGLSSLILRGVSSSRNEY